jgi:NTE family protein
MDGKLDEDHASKTALLPGATQDCGDLAVVLTGGGARGAYQVGALRYLARTFPELRIPIITGVSAGSINAALLAQHHGTLVQATEELAALWTELTPDRIFHVDLPGLLRNMAMWGIPFAGRGGGNNRARGLVDTEPLQRLLSEILKPVDGELTGIDYNLHRGTLRAVALGTTSYTTGQAVIWVHGRKVETWERPQRRSVNARLRVEHVMASAALPLFFPAVRIGDHWYGDGGIALTAPLAPAVHLGAHKILAISTRHARGFAEADIPDVKGYPPPAQVIGVLYDAIFLDVIDQDVSRLERMNQLLERLPSERRGGMRVIDLLVLRPSRDLAEVAKACEPKLPRAFRLLTRALGMRETERPEALSMIMFQPDYVERLIRLGEEDAERQVDQIAAFLAANGDG